MECRFLKHGIALSYDQILKPCCLWKYDNTWAKNNHITVVDITKWHQSDPIQKSIESLEKDQWPSHCVECEKVESLGRVDSIRGGGNRAYRHYDDDDITLEIRPGSTCNFACQTCWPEASSRVAQYYHRAGLIDIKNIDSHSFENFDLLLPIKERIKDVVLLGGEPFYDKSCRRFLDWAAKNLQSRLTMFTNGSQIDSGFIESYQGPLCIVVSLDATGRAAEYVRFGTEWDSVVSNYQSLKKYRHVELRVNITTSIYNYYHLVDLIEMLCEDWPNCVTFGNPMQDWMNEFSLPTPLRNEVISRLEKALDTVHATEIESGQKQNAINALESIVENLKHRRPWDQAATNTLKEFVGKMDRVKGISVKDYCDFLSRVVE
jgi:sulfatase maturation enzyme AslB (radical SAM superfamily)